MPLSSPMSTAPYATVLDFWFAQREQGELNVDSRMNCWFGQDNEFDDELSRRFSGLVEQALTDDLDDWADQPVGRLALILLLEQFPRHIHRDARNAYRGDKKALRLCEQGVSRDAYRRLSPVQQLFFFMPLQRSESLKIQQTSVKIFQALTDRAGETLRDTFQTVAQFAELRRDIIAEFGRFPHRNSLLGRVNTGAEDGFLNL